MRTIIQIGLALVIVLSFSSLARADFIWTSETGWIRDKTPVKATPEEQYEYARKLEQAKNYREAAKAYLMIDRFWPESDIGYKATYRGAFCSVKVGQLWWAYKAIEKTIKNHPDADNIGELIALEYKIGRMYASGVRKQFFYIRILNGYDAALHVFQSVLENDPFSEFADDAQLGIGQAYFNKHKYNEAISAVRTMIEKYPESDLIDEAKKTLALCYLGLNSRAEYAVETLEKAEEILNEYIENLSNDENESIDELAHAKEILTNINKTKAKKMYDTALYYQRQDNLYGTQLYCQKLLDTPKFKTTRWFEKAKNKLEEVNEKIKQQEAEKKQETEKKGN